MKTFFTAVLLSALIVFAGCAAQGPAAKKPGPQAAKSKEEVRADPGLAEKVRETAKTVKGVEDCTAVVIGGEISAAVKVRGFDRFRLESIREEVHRKIAGANQGFEVHVTSDKKLFSQLQQVERQVKQEKAPPGPEIKKRVEKINRDMQG